MIIHPWWLGFGKTVESGEELEPAAARGFASALAAGTFPGVTLVEIRQSADPVCAAVYIDVDVERPQDLAVPIKATEPVAVLFSAKRGQPSVLALRQDFPDTYHQNWTPPDAPCSLCVDDRPWAEARLTWTPADFLRRIQLWLAKAARGELHDPSQPPDPLFFASDISISVPASALAASAAPAELVGFIRQDNPVLILTQSLEEARKAKAGGVGILILSFRAQAQTMRRLRHAPVTLAGLADELRASGIDLINEIKERLKSWAGLKADDVRRLSSRLAIVVDFPIAVDSGHSVDDLRAFVSHDTAGEIGVALGVLHNNASKVGTKEAYVVAVPPASQNRDVAIEPAQVHLAFDRTLAAAIAGRATPDLRKMVLVGAGALGSQVAVDLAREGAFSWSIVDRDYLAPHNLARHALFLPDVGAPKAHALARKLGGLLGEPVTALVCDAINPDDQNREALAGKLNAADAIIDASASVAVSRHLSDAAVAARRVSVFLNPAGTAVVLLAEDDGRTITLRDLEAQYHRLVQTEPGLSGHLRTQRQGMRYSGSCRSVTNRIRATRAAMLSALAAQGIADALGADDALIRVWTIGDDGGVQVIRHPGEKVHSIELGSWRVIYDDGWLAALRRLRESRLPNETGGVLLGIADMSRRSIHVAHALPEPQDSSGSTGSFERGVAGLLEGVNRVVEESLHQLRYIGEWHSHPRYSSALPSHIDLAQLVWLGTELEADGLPGLMAIAADNGAFTFVIAGRGICSAAGEERATGTG